MNQDMFEDFLAIGKTVATQAKNDNVPNPHEGMIPNENLTVATASNGHGVFAFFYQPIEYLAMTNEMAIFLASRLLEAVSNNRNDPQIAAVSRLLADQANLDFEMSEEKRH